MSEVPPQEALGITKKTLNNEMLVLEDIPDIPEEIEKVVEPYINIRSAMFGDWGDDDTTIFFSTQFGQTSQIHRVKRPGGRREQLTFLGEPIRGFTYRPEHEQLAYLMDDGGSEYNQIFLFDLKTGRSSLISDGKSRNSSIYWRDDGRQLFYRSTRRNGRSGDIWVTKFSEDGTRTDELLVEVNDGYAWIPVQLSKDHKKLLILRYVSSTESDVYVYDIPTGKLNNPISGAQKHASRNLPIGFDEAANGFYLRTDRYSQYSQLSYFDIKNSKEYIISKDITWDVESAAISPDYSQGVFSVNENGYSRLYQFDTKSRKYHRLKGIKDGVIRGLKISKSGKHLAYTAFAPNAPGDIYVTQLGDQKEAQSAAVRWTFSETGGLSESQFIEPKLIHFPTFDSISGSSRKIPSWYFKPKSKEGRLPVIISIHGGPEGQARPYLNTSVQMWLKELGAAVLVPNVRGSQGYGKDYLLLDNGFKREDSVKDIGALLDWVKTQDELDPERILVIGGSYGGYMVLASAVHYSEQLLGAVDIVGISNFVTFLTNTKSYRRDLRRAEYGDERDPKMRAHLEHISPNKHVGKIKIPLFVIQGQNDPRVPVSEATQMVAALRKAKVPVWYMNALNEGHGYRKKENRKVYQQVVLMFMKSLFQMDRSGAL